MDKYIRKKPPYDQGDQKNRQNVAEPSFCQHEYTAFAMEKSSPKIWRLLCFFFKKAAQSKQLPNW
jgi:hypothetical protein